MTSFDAYPSHCLRVLVCHSLCFHCHLREHHSCAHFSCALVFLDLLSKTWMNSSSLMMYFSSRLKNRQSSYFCQQTISGTMIWLVSSWEHAEYLSLVSDSVPQTYRSLVVSALVGWDLYPSFPLLIWFLLILILLEVQDYFLEISTPNWHSFQITSDHRWLMHQNCFLNWYLWTDLSLSLHSHFYRASSGQIHVKNL